MMLGLRQIRLPAHLFTAVTALLWLGPGCGPTPPRLPAEPTALNLEAPRFTDRTLGRTGLACADCHSPCADRPLPGPVFPPEAPYWSGLAAHPVAAAGLCTERYLARTPLSPATLRALLADASGPCGPKPTDAPSLYAQACRHCHENGPAQNILGRAWTPDSIIGAVRGSSGPAHPGRLMPALTQDRLDDRRLTELADWICGQPRMDSDTLRREESTL